MTEEVKEKKEPPYIKLYLDLLSDINNTPLGTRNVLNCMLKRLQYDGLVLIRPRVLERIALECDYKGKNKIQQVRNKIAELVRIGILQREDVGTYAVNPYYFGRGDWRKVLSERESGIYGVKFTATITDGTVKYNTEALQNSDGTEAWVE